MIKPGERVPVDAEIMEGEAAIDEALLTGESTPVSKGPGDAVYAGTMVADSALVCRVTHPVGETRLAQITAVVEGTLNTKPPIQRLADRASRIFALGIVATTIVTFVGWWATGMPAAQSMLTADIRWRSPNFTTSSRDSFELISRPNRLISSSSFVCLCKACSFRF